MPVSSQATVQKTFSSAREKRRTVILLIALSLLIVALAVLGIYCIQSRQEHRRADEARARQIAALESELSERESELSSDAAKAQEQEGKIRDQESRLQEQDGKLRDQENRLQEQESTIGDLRRQLVLKKNQTTTVSGDTVTTAAPTAATTVLPVVPATGNKLVALTFDDGPGPYTGRLLDALKQHGAHATFFVIGSRVNSYADLIRRMEAEGHVVGNHSESHKNLKYLSAAQVAADMDACGQKINNILGHWPTVMRCPGGNYNDTVKAYAKKAGIPIIQWSVDTRDWESKNVSKILSTAFQKGQYGVRDGAIVLMHDIYKTTLEAAIRMLDTLQAQGYTMVTVPELLKAKKGDYTAGTVYSSAF